MIQEKVRGDILGWPKSPCDFFPYKNNRQETSGQNGGIGRYTLPPRTTKRRTTTNLKTKNNCQRIGLYRSLTTKELKKKHSSRLVGRMETVSWGGEDT